MLSKCNGTSRTHDKFYLTAVSLISIAKHAQKTYFYTDFETNSGGRVKTFYLQTSKRLLHFSQS